MLKKPDTCKACPLAGDMMGFVPDFIPPGDPKVAILAQNPGAMEESGEEILSYIGKNRVTTRVSPQPLIGATGYSLKQDFLPKAQLQGPVALLNVLRCRVQVPHKDAWAFIKSGLPVPEFMQARRTNDMPTGQVYKDAVKCCEQYLVLPDTVTHVVAHGAHAVNYTQGRPMSLKDWRGYELPGRWKGRPVFATLHTALLFRAPKHRVMALKDWSRVGKWVRGTWPIPIPARLICPHEVATEAGMVALQQAVAQGLRIACDTEFVWKPTDVPGHHRLTMIGFAWRTKEGPITGVQFVDYFEPVLGALKYLCQVGDWVFQNAAADLPVIEWNGGPAREEWL